VFSAFIVSAPQKISISLLTDCILFMSARSFTTTQLRTQQNITIPQPPSPNQPSSFTAGSESLGTNQQQQPKYSDSAYFGLDEGTSNGGGVLAYGGPSDRQVTLVVDNI